MFKLCVVACLLAVAAAKPSPAVVYTYSTGTAVADTVGPSVIELAPAPVTRVSSVGSAYSSPITYSNSYVYPNGYSQSLSNAEVVGYPTSITYSAAGYPTATSYSTVPVATYSSSNSNSNSYLNTAYSNANLNRAYSNYLQSLQSPYSNVYVR